MREERKGEKDKGKRLMAKVKKGKKVKEIRDRRLEIRCQIPQHRLHF
jgi:hypothetical protein